MTFSIPTTGTAAIKAVCACVFCLFSFTYLYVYQADILSYVVYSLTGSFYNDLLEATALTALLLLLQRWIQRKFPFGIRTYALTWLPSMLVLFLLTEVSLWGGWIYPVAITLFFVTLWLMVFSIQRKVIPYREKPAFFLFSRPMWINLLQLSLMMILVASSGTDNAVFHYRMKAETALLNGDTKAALLAGKRSLECDESLTMLRAYALAKEGGMGDALFTYAIKGKGDDLMPSDHAKMLICSPKDVFRFARTHKRAAADYELCGYLVDGRLDAFVQKLPRYYEINDSLPLHYREALTLYTHLRSHPHTVYHHAVMDEDYQNMKQMESLCKSASERHLKALELYGNTYWYYYNYVCRSRKSE